MPRIALVKPSRLPAGASRLGPHVMNGLMLHASIGGESESCSDVLADTAGTTPSTTPQP